MAQGSSLFPLPAHLRFSGLIKHDFGAPGPGACCLLAQAQARQGKGIVDFFEFSCLTQAGITS
jgi:hypothetical protein